MSKFDKVQEEYFKERMEQYIKETLKEMLENEKTEESEEEAEVIVTITDKDTSVKGKGNAITLLNGVVALSNMLEKLHGVSTAEIFSFIEVTKSIKND